MTQNETLNPFIKPTPPQPNCIVPDLSGMGARAAYIFVIGGSVVQESVLADPQKKAAVVAEGEREQGSSSSSSSSSSSGQMLEASSISDSRAVFGPLSIIGSIKSISSSSSSSSSSSHDFQYVAVEEAHLLAIDTVIMT
jgi:hypothetical protein